MDKKRLEAIKAILKDGDIILIHNLDFNIVSRGIMWFTSSRWNHTVWYYANRIYHWTTWAAKEDLLTKFIKPQYKICIRRVPNISEEIPYNIYLLAKEDVKKKLEYSKRSYLGYAISNISAKIPFIGSKLSRFLKKWKNPWREHLKRVCSSGVIQRWLKLSDIFICQYLGDEQCTPEEIYTTLDLVTVYEEKEKDDVMVS